MKGHHSGAGVTRKQKHMSVPVKGTLAILKGILLLDFPKHFGSHRLKHVTLQQSLAHAHHFVPGHVCTCSLYKR